MPDATLAPMDQHSQRKTSGSWAQVFICGMLSGVIINVIEYLAHRVWLDAKWNAAFAALGKTPSFWGTFVVANFLVGLCAVWSYRWLSAIDGRGRMTALKVAMAMWVIFWVIPIAGMQPFDIFPNYLLLLVVVGGIADVALGMLPVFALFDRLRR